MIFYAKAQSGLLEWSNKREIFDYLLSVDGKKLSVNIERETGVRTGTQNNALHKYFEMVSTALSEAGHTFDLTIGKKIVKLEWTPTLVKEAMWKPIQKALFGKGSTTKLDKTTEINQIYEHINRFLSNEPICIHVPFPHEDKKVEPPQNYPENNLGESPF
jgi:hypothetical protein